MSIPYFAMFLSYWTIEKNKYFESKFQSGCFPSGDGFNHLMLKYSARTVPKAISKVGFVFPMVIVSILPNEDLGTDDHCQDAPHVIILWLYSMIYIKWWKYYITVISSSPKWIQFWWIETILEKRHFNWTSENFSEDIF